jgi:predicted lipoprotein with Yx(FWY)xxD motif
MTGRKPLTVLGPAALIPLAALAVVGCGGSSGTSANAAPAHPKTTPPPKTASGARATVKTSNSGSGTILVDSTGRTLYLFGKDSGTTSACTGACATAWPPLLTKGKPSVGSGATASLVGTTMRSGGTTQVTYKGHPLYLFVKDTTPGETNGQGLTAFGGRWLTLTPAGNGVSAGAAQPAAAQPQPSAPKPQAAAKSNGIPQNGGGDGDSDNSGGPSDGDGGI